MQTIVLTGATGGLGQVLARKIIQEKCGNLICIYRNEDKFRSLFSDLLSGMHSHKTGPDDDYALLEDSILALPGKDVALILNAFSILPLKSVGEYSVQEMDEMINGNIRQNIVLLNRVTGLCRRKHLELKIINLDSGASGFPLRGWGNYCASKAYINSFLSVTALENPDFKVVSFDPGVMDTDMQRQIRETDKKVFDQVDTFISYKERGLLSDPSAVAEQLIERYVSHWKAAGMREKYRP